MILAAGKGKRFKSSTPKVLQPICGRPALWHVLQTARAARPDRIVIVVNQGAEQVREAVRSWGIRPEPVFVDQGEPLGTGHAVLAAEAAVGDAGEVLVMGGDYDPVTPDQVRQLLRVHRRTKSAATLLTAEVDDPGGYARIVHDAEGLRIVEDVTPALREVKEVSTLVFAFRRDDLFEALPLLGRENRQREYYLNHVFPILADKGERVTAVKVDIGGVMGVNSRGGLAAVERVLRERINAKHMEAGVTLVDPSATYIDVDVRIGADTVVFPDTFLEGKTTIGSGCRVGPSVRMLDSKVGDGSSVQFAVVLGSRIGRGVDVGPFVRMRPGTVLEDGAKVGAFIDMKNAKVGRESKVPHLSYIGDATIGERSNIGAGTITVNYDGYAKHSTVVGDDARIGSDTMLIAPIEIGDGAVTGAGSVVTKDVPPGALAVERAEQRIVPGYRKRRDAEAARNTGKARRPKTIRKKKGNV
ncbi:MAG: bifunctional UDP-N-acetylglucosamine diphosphorylase/glucosamine-1-phosphate N-acetyltransferase GlmU [Actinomycetota bacterium]